ncbi:MAG TPA: HAD family hydrolase [Blastocatellia bacterium]|nr:HAD family hydrolase [Blastocatellia bacterium]
MFDIIAFDADDTLWHNERHYTEAKERFKSILTRYHDQEWIEQRLDETELQNLKRYGYGIKSFTLSMIETAIQLTEGRIIGSEIQEIIALAWEMLGRQMEIFEGVPEILRELSASHRLMLITKGDLFEQEAKVSRSGLSDYFTSIEIVSEKTPQSYCAILDKHRIRPERFLMIGNSLRSDVLPVLEIGGHAIHIPFETTWVHEMVPEDVLKGRNFVSLDHLGQLSDWLNERTGRI